MEITFQGDKKKASNGICFAMDLINAYLKLPTKTSNSICFVKERITPDEYDLKAQKQELKKKVEGMKKEIPNPQGYTMNAVKEQQQEIGYNQALSDIINLLKE